MSDRLNAFGPTLRRYRDQAGLSQASLAEQVGTSRNSVVSWENNRARPDLATVLKLCELLGIPAGELLGLTEYITIGAQEQRLLGCFHDLTEENRRLVLRLVSAIRDEQAANEDERLMKAHIVLPLYETSAAAGTGYSWGDDGTPQGCILRRTALGTQADLLVRVRGDSMEPVYHSGQLVYVRSTKEIRRGWDVICTTENGPVIKRADGKGRLYSVNPALPFGEHYEDECIRVLGRVLGAADADLPDEAQLPLLRELLAEELREIER